MRTFLACAMLALSILSSGCGGGGGSSGPGIPPVEVLSSTLDQAQVGAPYAYALSAEGGEGAYTWSVAPDSPSQLPSSLTLNPATGIITGMPSDADAGTRTIAFLATDGIREARASLTFTVRARLAIAFNALPDAMQGSAFNLALATNGGAGHAHWALAANSAPLPAGLSLDSNLGRIVAPQHAERRQRAAQHHP